MLGWENLSFCLSGKGSQADTWCPDCPHRRQCDCGQFCQPVLRLIHGGEPWLSSDCAWITHSSNQPLRGGWGEQALPFLPHPHEGIGWWWHTDKANRVQHKICNPVLNIIILHLGASYSAQSGFENKIRSCGVSQPGLQRCSLNNCTFSLLCAWTYPGVR